MPYYKYEARDKEGKAVKGTVHATDRQELISRLQRENMLILSMAETNPVAAITQNRRLHKRAKLSDMRLFAQQFAILLENGVVITDALDVISQQSESRDLLEALQSMRRDLEGGMTLHESMSRNPRIFSQLWADLISAGEISGQIPFVARQMESFLAATERLRKKTINALIYPAFLTMAACSAITVFVTFVIPRFKSLYDTMNAKLPPLTQAVLSASLFINKYFLFVAIFIAVLIISMIKLLSTIAGRRAMENVIIKIPIAGRLFTAMAIEKFSSTLGVLLKSGIPIIRAIEISARATQSVIYSEKLEQAKSRVVAGTVFSESLRQTGLFPPLPVQLLLVAEKTGNFSGMLEEISKYYDDIIDVSVTRFTTILEPLILIVMGAIIGTLLLAMFLPIIKLSTGGV